MAKVTLTWTTTTTERFKVELDESKLPENWRELVDGPTDYARAFLGEYEYYRETGESKGFDERVTSREVAYEVLDQADIPALGQALNAPHVATYVASAKYPDLFTVLCSCGESSFGAMPRESAEREHTRHAADPAGGHFRDQAATARLLGNVTTSRKATS